MALDRPAIDSTDRSISPAMMIRVIGRAMIATSISAASRLAKLPVVRKTGDSALPSTISTIRATTSSVSQRASSASTTALRSRASRSALIGRRASVARWSRRRMTASALTATQDHEAVDRLEPELRQAEEDEGVGDEAEEQRADGRADDASRSRRRCSTPPTTTAAMTWSVTPSADVALIVPNSMTHMTPATPASRPHSGEGDEDDPPRRDAEDRGRLRVAADGVDLSPEARPAQDHRRDDDDDEHDHDEDRDARGWRRGPAP